MFSSLEFFYDFIGIHHGNISQLESGDAVSDGIGGNLYSAFIQHILVGIVSFGEGLFHEE